MSRGRVATYPQACSTPQGRSMVRRRTFDGVAEVLEETQIVGRNRRAAKKPV
jgi:hypothetical protein